MATVFDIIGESVVIVVIVAVVVVALCRLDEILWSRPGSGAP